MKIRFKEIVSELDFEIIKSLYLTAFPPNERREYNEFIQQIFIENYAVYLIYKKQKVAGFFILWNFDDFVFLEHFAIEAQLRGQGIGERVISLILKNSNKPVILETKPPSDETSKRRVNFYMRNGFNLLNIKYLQPSYDEIKPEVEMKLMCTSAMISPEKLVEYIMQIRRTVYKKIS